MSIRLVVFDLDGTLVDSLRDLADSANALLAECGASPLDRDVVGRMVGDGAATLVARAFTASGLAQPADALSRFLAIYNQRLLRFTRPYPGVPETLAALAQRVDLAVLTNKPIAATREILSGLALDRAFSPHRILGGDGPLPRKPDPSGLQSLMADAQASPGETVLVGDSSVDLHTARAAGAGAVLVRYGFGFAGVVAAELGNARVIDRPEDLLTDL